MVLLFIGDVVGQPGRKILKRELPKLRGETGADLVVVNGENAAGGNGITPATAEEIFRAGADVITTGNHVWDHREVDRYISSEPRLLRPANYPEPAPGGGIFVAEARNGLPVAVVNVMGRVFMPAVDDPFRTVDAILDELRGRASIVLVDFHAEATSEKIAMGWYLDGRVSVVVGTHTHVTTADERILPGGTAYITDVGMTGPHDSVIGCVKEDVLQRFLTQRPVRLSTASHDVRLAGLCVEVAPDRGHALTVRRLEVRAGHGSDHERAAADQG